MFQIIGRRSARDIRLGEAGSPGLLKAWGSGGVVLAAA